MRRLRSHVERVAPTEATVLITGEHGSGKEMVAREIFRLAQEVENLRARRGLADELSDGRRSRWL